MMSEELSHVGMTQCFYCWEDFEILMETRFEQDKWGRPIGLKKTLPRKCGVRTMEPCNKCKDYMKLGVIVISATDESIGQITANHMQWDLDERRRVEDARARGALKSAHFRPFIPNPHRMGFWAVMKDECIQAWPVPEEFKAHALKARWCFIPHEAAIAWGFLEAAKLAPQG